MTINYKWTDRHFPFFGNNGYDISLSGVRNDYLAPLKGQCHQHPIFLESNNLHTLTNIGHRNKASGLHWLLGVAN